MIDFIYPVGFFEARELAKTLTVNCPLIGLRGQFIFVE
jgi:hypothetical protein